MWLFVVLVAVVHVVVCDRVVGLANTSRFVVVLVVVVVSVEEDNAVVVVGCLWLLLWWLVSVL